MSLYCAHKAEEEGEDIPREGDNKEATPAVHVRHCAKPQGTRRHSFTGFNEIRFIMGDK